MNILQIIMAVVFGLSAVYIIWCLCKATKYMREHQDEFNMTYPPKFEDNRPGAVKNSKKNKTN